MQVRWRLFTLIASLILSLSACSANDSHIDEQQTIKISSPSKQQAVDIVWQALEPNTSSHDRAAWELVDVRLVKGHEVQDLFEGEPVPGNCAPGPSPQSNSKIFPSGSFWYVLMKPLNTTPRLGPTQYFSPTAPPNIPEPFLYQAHFLIDFLSGKVIARKLYCVIY